MKRDMLSAMLVFATQKHEGQFDKGGHPYILHPLKVMHYLKSDDEELMCIALGHDLMEDCEVTEDDLLAIGMSWRVINGIAALTKDLSVRYEVYKEQVKANPDAVRVKMADLRHNTDIRRLKGVKPKDLERVCKYMEFYEELKACL